MSGVRWWTDDDDARLKRDYSRHADNGTLNALASEMGRTRQFICRKAKALGLTNKRRVNLGARKVDRVTEEQARELFAGFQGSGKTLSAFAKGTEFSANALSSIFSFHFESDFAEEVEKSHRRNWRYAAGRRFEYRVRDRMESLGLFCMRSPGSKSPVDILGVDAGIPVFVQCKTGPWYSVPEWNDFIDLCALHEALPVYATRQGNKLSMKVMTQRKDGSRQSLSLPDWRPGMKPVWISGKTGVTVYIGPAASTATAIEIPIVGAVA